MSDARSTHLSVSGYSNRFLHNTEQTLRNVLRSVVRAHPRSISELLAQVEEVTTAAQLTKLVNKVQVRLFKLPTQKAALWRKHLVDVLTLQVLYAPEINLRTEAAGWLRLFMQTGLISHPEGVFVTLVTEVVRLSSISNQGKVNDQYGFLQLIFDCFWPYRYPYPAYTWEAFPANDIFYPLAPLLSQEDENIQDALISIFNELPTLHDEKIAEHLLPIALRWSGDDDSERRSRIAYILCKMNQPAAQEALLKLQRDSNPLVAASARRAIESAQQA
jgi:hypothetical protein